MLAVVQDQLPLLAGQRRSQRFLKGRPGTCCTPIPAATAGTTSAGHGQRTTPPAKHRRYSSSSAAVPILLILLVLDRAQERWYVPVVVCGLLAWAQVADELAVVAVAVPVGAVAVVRLVVLAIRLRPLREFWYDTALGMAATVSILLAAGTEKAIRALGGFDLLPLPQQLLVTRSQLPGHIRALGETLLLLFGANGQGNHGLAFLAQFHLIGLALAGLALLAAIVWYVTRVDRVTQVVVAAAVATMAAAILTIELSSVGQAHEVAVLLPFGAVLAGRVLPGPLPDRVRAARRALLPAGGAWLAVGLAALCYAATGAPVAAENMPLAGWLTAHGYTEGLAAYWQASSTTVDSGGKTLVAPVTDQDTAVYAWEADAAWYDPGTRRAGVLRPPSAHVSCGRLRDHGVPVQPADQACRR